MGEKAAKQQEGNGSLIAAAFAVWAAAMIVAFLSYRGNDVGQLRNLIANARVGFGADGFTSSFFGLMIAVFICQAWFGVGFFLLRLVKFEIRSTSLILSISAAIGAAVWSLVWFLLGIAGAYYPATGVAAIVVGAPFLAAAATFLKANVQDEVEDTGFWSGLSASGRVIVALTVFSVILALIAALAPPIAKDTLLYHFALPKTYVLQHNNSFVEGNIASYLALGGEMHTVWAMLVGGLFDPRTAEAAAGATNFIFFPLTLAATFGWTRELGLTRSTSLLATLLIASIPTAFYVAGSGYIDLELALFVTLATLALTKWWKTQEKKWLVLVATFLGGALSIKLTAIFIFAAFALIILLRARAKDEKAGSIILSGFAALLLAGALASPWYLRTWKATGSPVFPFYMSMWKGQASGWDVERSNLFQGMNAQYGGEQKNLTDYALAPVNISVIAQPDDPRYFDGVLGVAFLIGSPLLIWALWKFDLPAEVKIAAGVAGVMFLFWLFSSQQLRYLLPIIPLFTIAIVSSLEMISRKIGGVFDSIARIGFAAASVAGLLVSFAWFLQAAPLRVVLGGESRDEYLARDLDYYPYYQWLNTETAPDAKVWLINIRRDTYNIDRHVLSDYLFEDWTLRKMIWEARSLPELKAKVAAMGVSYVLTRHDFLFDYDRSTIVDDKRPRAENEAKLKMARDLILDPANTIRSDDKFSLIKVFSKE